MCLWELLMVYMAIETLKKNNAGDCQESQQDNKYVRVQRIMQCISRISQRTGKNHIGMDVTPPALPV